MKLSTRTRYGARAMLDLALRYPSEPISAAEVAESQGISVKYLENLLTNLRKAGLVRSLRGAGGGHVLARPPEEITLLDVFEALEGIEGFVPCTGNTDVCDRTPICATEDVWAEMYGAATKVLDSWTLSDLVDRAQDKRRAHSAMYYI